MKRCTQVGLCALVAGVLTASGVSAATIQEVLAIPFNPIAEDFYATGYGQSAYLLTWTGSLNGNLFDEAGSPGPNFTYQPPGGNPAWLMFEAQGGGGGAGGGGGPGTAIQSSFTLGNNLGGVWGMDFSVLLFDPDFTGTGITVELLGSAAGTDYVVREVEAADVVDGMMLTWRIAAEAGENVLVRVTSYGDESYAAGFFMDNENVSVIPEPATLALLTLGLAGVVLRRRR